MLRRLPIEGRNLRVSINGQLCFEVTGRLQGEAAELLHSRRKSLCNENPGQICLEADKLYYSGLLPSYFPVYQPKFIQSYYTNGTFHIFAALKIKV
jgi:hypothetical protein